MPVAQTDLYITLQKMVFIYNALLTGWTVVMIDDNKFEFKKGVGDRREVNFEDYVKRFIEYNMNIENLK